MKFAYLVFGMAWAVVSFAQDPTDSLILVNREIEQTKSKLLQCDRDNPHVYFNDQDNPTRNIHRTMKETRINHEFYCPNHRGFKYEKGICGWIETQKNNFQGNRRELSCAAASNNINGYAVWRSLCDQAAVTEAKDAEHKKLQEALADLSARRRVVIQMNSERSTTATARKAAVGPGNDAEAIVIRLPKKKVYELYSNKVTYHDGYKLIIQN